MSENIDNPQSSVSSQNFTGIPQLVKDNVLVQKEEKKSGWSWPWSSKQKGGKRGRRSKKRTHGRLKKRKTNRKTKRKSMRKRKSIRRR